MSTTQKILAALLVLTALVGGTVFMYQGLQSARMQPAVATIWPTPKPLPEFSLLDHSGNEFTTENLQGQWSLVFFGFTHCPDICPATLQQLAIARSRLKESGKATPNIILVMLRARIRLRNKGANNKMVASRKRVAIQKSILVPAFVSGKTVMPL